MIRSSRIVLTLLLSVTSFFLYAQMDGPTSGNPGINMYFSYDDGSVYSTNIWQVTNGSIISKSVIEGTHYMATISFNANSVGTQTVTFKGSASTLSVVITCPTLSPPSATFSVTNSCGSSAITRSGTVPTGVTWYWQNSQSNPNTSLGNATTLTVATSGTYYLASSYNAAPTCWSGTGNGNTVTVTNTPTLTISGNQTVCGGTTSNCTINSNVSGTTYSWTATPTGVNLSTTSGTTNTIGGYMTTTSNTQGSVLYNITATTPAGCHASTTSTMYVNPQPAPVATNNTPTICSQSSTNISLSSWVSGTTFGWIAAPTGVAVSGATSGNLINQVLTTPGSSDGGVGYTITATTPVGCTGSTTSTVAVKSNAGGTLTPALQEFFISPVGLYYITASGYSSASGTTILWQQSNDGTNWATAAGSPWNTTPNYQYPYSILGAIQYRLQVTNGTCVGYSPIASVIVSQAPTVMCTSCNGSPAYIAIGDSVTLNASTNYNGANYYSYQWSKSGTDIPGATGSTYVATDAASYTVRVTPSATSPAATSPNFYVFGVGLQPDFTTNAIVTTTIRKKGVTSSTNLYTDRTITSGSYSQMVEYLDLKSRPLQTVAIGQSPSQKDIVIPYSYDTLVPTSYLPYVATVKDGRLRTTALNNNGYTNSEQYSFYQHTDTKIDSSTTPYAKTVYESSPIGRVIEQGAAGTDWQPGAHTVKAVFHTNNTSFGVRTWNTNGPTGYYAANLLAVSRVTDENGNPVMSYSDKLGRTVLKRVKTSSMPDSTTWLDTYYVYDTRGNLTMQVPPKVSAMLNNGTAWSSTLRDTWCFVYKYTSRNQLEQKQGPGTVPVYYVYDTLGRLVLTQDGNLRSSKQWAFVKYDIKGRAIMSGLYTDAVKILLGDVKALVKAQYANPLTPWYEERGTALHGYTNQSFPMTNGDGSAFTSSQILSVNYYDNYDFDYIITNGKSDDYSYTPQGLPGESTQGNSFGLATGNKRLVMDGTNSKWLYSYVFYDRFGRVIQTQTNNHLSSAVDNVGTIVYDFEGKVKQVKTKHNAGGTNQYIILQTNSYDSAGRLVQVTHGINGASPLIVAKYEYNELGQMVDKKLHNTNGSFLQSVDYRYHIRGWLSSINNAKLANDGITNDDLTDYFGMEVLYNTVDSLSYTANYNGNIGALKWKGVGYASGSKGQRSYVYTYDKSDKLKSATFQANSTWKSLWAQEGNTLNESMSYDHNGNILNLQRKQNVRTVDGTNTATPTDNLIYTYAFGNKLSNVSDAASGTVGFVDLSNAPSVKEYSYDTLGNLTSDKNKGISSITYNVLGKAQQINFTNGNSIVYTYDAAGSKLTMTSTVSGTQTTTNYVGGFVYNTNTTTNVSTLNFFSSPEGRVVKNTSGNFEYQYAITDHQGNTRVLFTSAQQQTESRTATFEGSDDTGYYKSYPTGTTNFGTINNHTASGSHSQLLYAGQVGLSKSYHVYPGDKVHIDAWGMYRNLQQSGSNLSGFAATLLQAFQLSTPAVGETGTASSGLNAFGGLEAGGWGDGSPDNTDVRAFVNIVMFDKNFSYLDAAYAQLTATSDGVFVSMSQDYIAKEEGYAFLYISNENQKLVDVYFDDITMSYTPSNILQGNEYYPFGLQTTNSWTRDNSITNNFLGNGGTELNTTSSLYDLDYRNFDPILGRMNQVDPMADKYGSLTPYNYAFNSPVVFNDVNGADPAWYRSPYINYHMDADHEGPAYSPSPVNVSLDPGLFGDVMPDNPYRSLGGNGVELTNNLGFKPEVFNMISSAWNSWNTRGGNSGNGGYMVPVTTTTQGKGSIDWGKFGKQTLAPSWIPGAETTTTTYSFVSFGPDLTQSSVTFNYRFFYDDKSEYLPYPPTEDKHLGKTIINKRGSSFKKNASGGYDITIAISILRNKALRPESDFFKRNPRLALDVLYHELAHAFIVEMETNKRNIPEALMNSGYDDDSSDQKDYFQRILIGIGYSTFERKDGPLVDQYKFQFAPCNYSFRDPIIWEK